MSKSILLLFIAVFTSCQSVKIKGICYKTSNANIEIGNIGQAKSMCNLNNSFEQKTVANLNDKIRVSVDVVPYTKELSEIYQRKSKFNQNQSKLTYVDSLPSKPELAVIRLFDVTGFINALNAEHNKDVFDLLQNSKKPQVVSSIAVGLTKEELDKIRQADTYYLINNQDRKYAVALFKQGKKTETIDLNLGTVLAYRLSKFCWTIDNKGKWHIADLAEGKSKCKGKMKSKVSEKEKTKSLYRM